MFNYVRSKVFEGDKDVLRLFEYEAKEALRRFGISLPLGFLASTPMEAGEAVAQIGKLVVLKAQVLVGGRGKSGGIQTADTPEEAAKNASRLLASRVKGSLMRRLLIEERIDVSSELYMGITIDHRVGKPVVMVSAKGGVEIEKVAVRYPTEITRSYIDIFRRLPGYDARRLVKQMGLEGSLLTTVGDILQRLYVIFRAYDAELVEINPLAITNSGQVIALDSRLNVDDHSLYRHAEIDSNMPDRFDDPLEFEGRHRGVNYVNLDGEVALMGNGAGLTMAIMDMIAAEGIRPACFLDTGGGVSRDQIKNALDLLMMKAEFDTNVKAILFNVNLQITIPEDLAQGIKDVVESRMHQIRQSNILLIGVIRGTGAERDSALLEMTPVIICRDAREAINMLISQLGR
jgi:succinyl-CoA synthetase beta subunit